MTQKFVCLENGHIFEETFFDGDIDRDCPECGCKKLRQAVPFDEAPAHVLAKALWEATRAIERLEKQLKTVRPDQEIINTLAKLELDVNELKKAVKEKAAEPRQVEPEEPKKFQFHLATTLTFGKYTGKTVDQVASEDPAYICWMVDNFDRTRYAFDPAIQRIADLHADEIGA